MSECCLCSWHTLRMHLNCCFFAKSGDNKEVVCAEYPVRGHRLSIFIFFNGIWPLRSEPPPLPVNGLLPNGPPIGLKSLAFSKTWGAANKCLVEHAGLQPKIRHIGRHSKTVLFYTLYVICKDFIYAFKKILLRRFPYDFLFS